MSGERIIRAAETIQPVTSGLFLALCIVIGHAYAGNVTIMPLEIGTPGVDGLFGFIDIRETTFATIPSGYYANPLALSILLSTLAAPAIISIAGAVRRSRE